MQLSKVPSRESLTLTLVNRETNDAGSAGFGVQLTILRLNRVSGAKHQWLKDTVKYLKLAKLDMNFMQLWFVKC
jgi:hypothetical protein